MAAILSQPQCVNSCIKFLLYRSRARMLSPLSVFSTGMWAVSVHKKIKTMMSLKAMDLDSHVWCPCSMAILGHTWWVTNVGWLIINHINHHSNLSHLAINTLRQKQNRCHNTSRLRQNRRHFADTIFKCIFLNENVWIFINISLKFVPKGPIDNIPALVQIMAWRWQGD